MNELATYVDGTDDRWYLVSDNTGLVIEWGRHGEQEWDEAQAEAEAYAEFGSSWVFGGGRVEDVGAAWHAYKAEKGWL